MIIIVLTDCPPKLRGDMSKWLFEINTGVYVGRVSARVREELWSRICESVRHGQATMVYPAPGEQRMEFRVHNTTWEVVDYDGIKLMRRPLSHGIKDEKSKEIYSDYVPSKASIYQRSRRIQNAKQKIRQRSDYIVFDLETTGLSHLKDHIIEISALKVRNGQVEGNFHALVQCNVPLPETIKMLTGLTDIQIMTEGRPLYDVLEEFLTFIGSDLLVLYNVAFDYGFLQAACRKVQLPVPKNQCEDVLRLARKKLIGLDGYTLENVAKHFGMDVTGCHRAQNDCELTFGIYQKLKEI